jgi:hypothetical protein
MRTRQNLRKAPPPPRYTKMSVGPFASVKYICRNRGMKCPLNGWSAIQKLSAHVQADTCKLLNRSGNRLFNSELPP